MLEHFNHYKLHLRFIASYPNSGIYLVKAPFGKDIEKINKDEISSLDNLSNKAKEILYNFLSYDYFIKKSDDEILNLAKELKKELWANYNVYIEYESPKYGLDEIKMLYVLADLDSIWHEYDGPFCIDYDDSDLGFSNDELTNLSKKFELWCDECLSYELKKNDCYDFRLSKDLWLEGLNLSNELQRLLPWNYTVLYRHISE